MKAADILLAVLVALVWGFNFVVIKVGLGAFPPILFVALRFFFAAVPAVFFISRKGIPWRWLIALGVSLGVVKFGLLFVGMNMGMPAGLSSLVLQCQAVFTLLMAALVLKDVPTKWQAGGVIVACAGMGLLISDMSGTPSFTGLMLVIAAGFFWGVSNIIMKKVGKVDMLSLIVWMSLVAPLPLLGLSAVMETGQWEAITQMTLTGAGVLFYISIISTVFAFGAWAQLFKQYSPNMVAPFSLLVPIFGILSASVVLGEEFTVIEMAASCLVFSGILLVVFGNRIAELVSKVLSV